MLTMISNTNIFPFSLTLLVLIIHMILTPYERQIQIFINLTHDHKHLKFDLPMCIQLLQSNMKTTSLSRSWFVCNQVNELVICHSMFHISIMEPYASIPIWIMLSPTVTLPDYDFKISFYLDSQQSKAKALSNLAKFKL